MISVTTITSYLYCPRKLYLERIEGYVEIPKDILVKGAVKHRVFDELTSTEELIVSGVSKDFDWNKTLKHYEEHFSKILRRSVLKSARQIKMAKLNPMTVFNEFSPFFNKEAETRAKYVFDFMNKNKVYGQELWDSLIPKIKSEYKVSSVELDLSGKIDRVDLKKTKTYVTGIEIAKKDGTKAFYPIHPSNLIITELNLDDKRRLKRLKG